LGDNGRAHNRVGSQDEFDVISVTFRGSRGPKELAMQGLMRENTMRNPMSNTKGACCQSSIGQQGDIIPKPKRGNKPTNRENKKGVTK